jgi:hypothetical protein
MQSEAKVLYVNEYKDREESHIKCIIILNTFITTLPWLSALLALIREYVYLVDISSNSIGWSLGGGGIAGNFVNPRSLSLLRYFKGIHILSGAVEFATRWLKLVAVCGESTTQPSKHRPAQ